MPCSAGSRKGGDNGEGLASGSYTGGCESGAFWARKKRRAYYVEYGGDEADLHRLSAHTYQTVGELGEGFF